MFGGEACDKKVKVLSGGEKTRLAIHTPAAEPVNLLILDEPTNHLDMATKDILKQAIKDFDGTVIVVSHDREFLDGLVEKVYEFGGGKVRECLGGIWYEFLERRSSIRLPSLSATSPRLPTKPVKTQEIPRHLRNRRLNRMLLHSARACVNYTEQRERQRMVKRAEKKVAEAEASIADIEARIAGVEGHVLLPARSMPTYSSVMRPLASSLTMP